MIPAFVLALLLWGPSPVPDDLSARIAQTPADGTLELDADTTYRVSVPLVLSRPIRIVGHGARIVVDDGAKIADAVIVSQGVDRIALEDMTIDANVDHNGADYGIWIRGGSRHRVSSLHVSNSSQACILLEDASGSIESNTLDHCGRELTIRRGGATNNHAILIAALTRPVSGVSVVRNTVLNAYRKGITTYTRAPGSLSHVTIAENHVSSAGLGGIYVANAPGASTVYKVAIRGNIVRNSYVGYEVDNVTDLTLSDNLADNMRDRAGRPGAEGLVIHKVRNANIQSLTVHGSGSGGITVIDSRNVELIAPSIVDGNDGNYGYAPGIQLRGSSNVNVKDMSIVDTSARTRLHAGFTHGFVEIGPAGGNRSSVRRMDGISLPMLRMPR
ncbi:right-handed parallel beta-helix repeat-containing protein [Sphingomonas sanguinis]|uniref:Right handed beta helix domain-containing protein n=1 Tax=Sphingomonas sanguinis TaxID=33051 RepID=A0A147HWD4_9SPHN|nr:right-handed parallel beta-helix repeat-containing protein [Sphingomonas sanguinis]KTT69244.1 hypothetical protein NS319_10925 [Sphingomonas sanguinis]